MTEQELKEKIKKIVAPYISAWGDDDAIADALISARISDVKEAELERKAYEVASNQYRIWFEEQKDRAEVAERALDKATELAYTYCTQDDTFSCSSCPFNSIFDRCKKRGLYEDCSKRWKKELLRQAEKELQEERKNVR